MSVCIATTPPRLCKWYRFLQEFSLDHQVIPPYRVIVGMAWNKPVLPSERHCMAQFANSLKMNVTYAIVNVGRLSAGYSRNACIDEATDNEALFFHDDDDYLHPQSIQILDKLLRQKPDIGLIVGSYVTDRRTHGTVWCVNPQLGNLESLYSTSELHVQPSGFGVENGLGKENECRRIHQAYVVVRSHITTQLGLRFDVTGNHREDSMFLSDAVRQRNVKVLFVCFPLVAYRSALHKDHKFHDLVGPKGSCGCFHGYAKCLGDEIAERQEPDMIF